MIPTLIEVRALKVKSKSRVETLFGFWEHPTVERKWTERDFPYFFLSLKPLYKQCSLRVRKREYSKCALLTLSLAPLSPVLPLFSPKPREPVRIK